MESNLPSTKVVSIAADRQLSALVKAGFMTEGDQRAVSTAVVSAQVMRAVSTPVGERGFNKIDTQIDIRFDTPISRARECLQEMNEVWAGISDDFYHYRKLVAEAKLLRAKAARTRADENADEVAQAEADLLDIQADEMEAKIRVGEAKFKQALEKVGAHSKQYALVCAKAGKESFTEDDFRQEEIRYLVQSIIWHAAQTSTMVDMRDKYARGADDRKRDSITQGYGQRAADGWHRQEQLKHAVVMIPKDAQKYLGELGVDLSSFTRDLEELARMREGHDSLGPRVDPFEPKFDGWVQRTTEKYLDVVKATVALVGTTRLDRIRSLLNHEASDKGKNQQWGEINRGSWVDS